MDTHANYLPTPFPGRIGLTVQSASGEKTIVGEWGYSDVEIFQSASYRQHLHPDMPLVLTFDAPSVPYYCMQKFQIPLELITVPYETNRVGAIMPLVPHRWKGNHIQGFSGLRAVILAVPGFSERNGILPGKTRIQIHAIGGEKTIF